MQVVDSSYRFVAERDDDVAFTQPRRSRRTAIFNPNYDHARFLRQIVEANDPPVDGNGLRRAADVTAPDSSIAKQPAGNKFCGIDADGKADSLRRQDCCRVYTDDLAA